MVEILASHQGLDSA